MDKDIEKVLKDRETTSPPTKSDSVVGSPAHKSKVSLLDIPTLLSEYDKLGELEHIPLLGLNEYITKGWTTLISGSPKSGKTELLTQFAIDCCKDSRSILWITEEGIRVFAERIKRRNVELPNMKIALALNADPRDIEALMREAKESIVVLDTVRTLLKIRNENDNSEVALRLAPIIRTAQDKQQTLLLVHHLRKGGGEHGEGAVGASAYMSSVDAGLEIRRYGYDSESRKREIHGWGRLDTIPTVTYEMNEDYEFKVLGEPSSVRLSEVANRIDQLLTNEWQTTKDICISLDEPKPSSEQVRRALNLLFGKSKAERNPKEDKQGARYKWRRKPPTTASPYIGSEVTPHQKDNHQQQTSNGKKTVGSNPKIVNEVFRDVT